MAPGVLHVRFAGHLQAEHVHPMIAGGDLAIAQGFRPLVAIDAHDVHAYETEVRKMWQRWLFEHRERVFANWVLFRSPLIKMAVTLINPVVGGIIRPFASAQEFDIALAGICDRARQGDPQLRQDGTTVRR